MATLNFDATQVEPSSGKEPIPAGRYLAAIIASEIKPTKNGSGKYLELEYQVLTGEHKGRKLWSRHNLYHQKAQTVEIARGELSAVCRAVGILMPKDSAELHNHPLLLTVRRKNREDTGEATNEVIAWSTPDAPASAAQGGPTTPAWLRR